jgi:hypothetical protein
MLSDNSTYRSSILAIRVFSGTNMEIWEQEAIPWSDIDVLENRTGRALLFSNAAFAFSNALFLTTSQIHAPSSGGGG